MKTYCKPKDINIEDISLIERAVYKAFDGKFRRRDFQALLISSGAITKAELANELSDCSRVRINAALDALAAKMRRDIQARRLRITPVRPFQRVDGLTQKTRDLCKEGAYQQVCEYICVEALQPLFRAKLLPCQYGSVPGRGQLSGAQKIEKIVRKHKGSLAAAKCDVKKAYPSTHVAVVMRMLRRDVGKNEPLLWLLSETMRNYPDDVLIIGGYLSTWLFNYVMSYLLRVALADGRRRRGKWIPSVQAVVSYADDTALFGSKSGVVRALRAATRWAAGIGLTIKPAWQIIRFAPLTGEKQNATERRAGSRRRTPGLDMMGFVVRRRCTIIRKRIWLRIRRCLLRTAADVARLGRANFRRARRLLSYKGWIAATDSQEIETLYGTRQLLAAAAEIVGAAERRTRCKQSTLSALTA